MNTVIYFDNGDQRIDRCSNQVYIDFLDYAFAVADYFMLVYVNYYGKGYTKVMKTFKNLLEPFKVKSRKNPSWPGTLKTMCPNTTYRIVFYRTDARAKTILKQVSCLSQWSSPSYPQDLAFFKGNQCWFYSVGHEKIGAIIHATEQDLNFVEAKGLSSRMMAFESQNSDFEAYNEIID